jgi:hypothetical protein
MAARPRSSRNKFFARVSRGKPFCQAAGSRTIRLSGPRGNLSQRLAGRPRGCNFRKNCIISPIAVPSIGGGARRVCDFPPVACVHSEKPALPRVMSSDDHRPWQLKAGISIVAISTVDLFSSVRLENIRGARWCVGIFLKRRRSREQSIIRCAHRGP